MATHGVIQIANLVDTSRPRLLIREVRHLFCLHYSRRYFRPVRRAYRLTRRLFEGRFPGYGKCNTEYHNFPHTLDALLAAARLVDGYNLQHDPLPVSVVINLFIAALLHDTGYIQESWDNEGTGAKYTTTHVERSIQFLQKNAAAFKITGNDALAQIANNIRCTGLSVSLETISFGSPEERFAGCTMGTADILGQMSDRSYLEKLIFLYNEFREAGVPGFNTEYDLIRKTVDFYEITLKRMTESYMGIFTFAQNHFSARYGINHNLYIEAINRHIGYLHKIIEDESTNFRRKLKRGAWVDTYPKTTCM